MATYSEEVKRLAETLKNSGLAASMTDALERAQRMVGKKEEPKEREEPIEKIDVTQTTLGEVKEDKKDLTIEESAPEDELKKEEVFTNPAVEAEEANEEKKEPEKKKVDYSKEKKVDLSDIFNVNK